MRQTPVLHRNQSIKNSLVASNFRSEGISIYLSIYLSIGPLFEIMFLQCVYLVLLNTFLHSSLRELYQLLKRAVTQFSTTIPDKPACLVLDDISVLISLGVTVAEIMTFIKHCYQLVTGKLFEVRSIRYCLMGTSCNNHYIIYIIYSRQSTLLRVVCCYYK